MPHIWDEADTVVKSQAGFGKLSGRMTSEGADSRRSLARSQLQKTREILCLEEKGGLLCGKIKFTSFFNSADVVSYRFFLQNVSLR